MPIRFRCAYCNQLMGIARRKAGTVVKCPKCAGDIIVPVPEGMQPQTEGAEQAEADAPDHPRAETGGEGTAATAASTQPSSGPPSAPPYEPPPVRRIGIFLSLGSIAISIVVVILLLILMFVLGLIIGRQTAVQLKDVASNRVSECSLAV